MINVYQPPVQPMQQYPTQMITHVSQQMNMYQQMQMQRTQAPQAVQSQMNMYQQVQPQYAQAQRVQTQPQMNVYQQLQQQYQAPSSNQINNNGDYGFPLLLKSETEKKGRTTADDYKHWTEHQRAFWRPQIYIGEIQKNKRTTYAYIPEKKCFVKGETDVPEALIHLFRELIANVSDNARETRDHNGVANCVEIYMDNEWFSIKNDGFPIALGPCMAISNPNKIYTVIDYIFGVLGTGSNYHSKATKKIGQNGLGVKLLNVHAQRFEGESGSQETGIYQKSVWSHNMTKHVSSLSMPSYVWNSTTQKVEEQGQKYVGPSFTKLSVKLDLRTFGYAYLTDEIKYLVMKECIDLSFTAKLIVHFNDQKFDYRNINDYAQLYFPGVKMVNKFIHYEWPDGIDPAKAGIKGRELENIVAECKQAAHIPTLEICVCDAPGYGDLMSFVNGQANPKGGVHISSISDKLFPSIKDVFREDKTGVGLKIDARDIKKNIFTIVNANLVNPQFNGQIKDKLTSPKVNAYFLDEDIKKMKKWDMIKNLYQTIDAKLKNEEKKAGGKRSRHVTGVSTFSDANYAGTEKSLETTLMLGEGTSACRFLSELINNFKNGLNYWGYKGIKGKFKNVTDVSYIEILRNEEIQELKRCIGLEDGEDYSTEKGIRKLRYGRICICTDADTDGSHIASLLINFFFVCFPSLLYTGRVCIFMTPVVRITQGDVTKERFYNIFDFENWIKLGNKSTKKNTKYYKGLASSTSKDVVEDSKMSPLVNLVMDQNAASTLTMVFSEKYTDNRKDVIEAKRNYVGTKQYIFPSDKGYWTYITDYMSNKWVEYSIDTFRRALPDIRDILKKSQRQVIDTGLKIFDKGNDVMKISEFAAQVVTATSYHHGEVSLEKAITTLAQQYTGSNNLTIFAPHGMYGSRNGKDGEIGGDTGMPRYIFTNLAECAKYIYNKDLINMIEKNVVEFKEVEHNWLPCDVPLTVINGGSGVANGWSFYMPSYNPIDVIDWIYNYICYKEGDKTKPLYVTKLVPWFRGFKGYISVEQKETKKGDFEKETLRTYGVYEVIAERVETFIEEKNGKKISVQEKVHDIRVHELPVYVAGTAYDKWLDGLIVDGKIKDRRKIGDTNNPGFDIISWRGEINEKELRLVTAKGINNITMIDNDAKPYRLKNINNVMKVFCDNMIEQYSKYYKLRVENSKKEIETKYHFIRMITFIVGKQLRIVNVKSSTIDKFLNEQGIPLECYDRLNARKHLTEEAIMKETAEYNQMKIAYENLLNEKPCKVWIDNLSRLRQKLVESKEYDKLPQHVLQERFMRIDTPEYVTYVTSRDGYYNAPLQGQDIYYDYQNNGCNIKSYVYQNTAQNLQQPKIII